MTASVSSVPSSTIVALKNAGAHYESVKEDTSLRKASHGAGRELSLVNQALEAAAVRSKSVGVSQRVPRPALCEMETDQSPLS